MLLKNIYAFIKGVINIPARISVGILCDKKFLSPFNIYIITTTLAVFGCFFFIFLSEFWMLLCFGIAYGISSGKLRIPIFYKLIYCFLKNIFP